MKDELGGTVMLEFVALRPKRNYQLINDDSSKKNFKGKKGVIKRILNFTLHEKQHFPKNARHKYDFFWFFAIDGNIIFSVKRKFIISYNFRYFSKQINRARF